MRPQIAKSDPFCLTGAALVAKMHASSLRALTAQPPPLKVMDMKLSITADIDLAAPSIKGDT
jgi:hypothetical protein